MDDNRPAIWLSAATIRSTRKHKVDQVKWVAYFILSSATVVWFHCQNVLTCPLLSLDKQSHQIAHDCIHFIVKQALDLHQGSLMKGDSSRINDTSRVCRPNCTDPQNYFASAPVKGGNSKFLIHSDFFVAVELEVKRALDTASTFILAFFLGFNLFAYLVAGSVFF